VDVSQMRRVLDKMVPRQERFVLRFLMQFLTEVAAHSAKNMMHAANLGVVIAPNIFRLPDGGIAGTSAINSLVELMIDNYEQLFADKPHSAASKQGTANPSQQQQQQQPESSDRSTTLATRRSSLMSTASGSPSPRRAPAVGVPRTSPAAATALLNASGRSNGSASRRPSLSPTASRVAAARAAAAAAEVAGVSASTARMSRLRRESGGMGSPMASASSSSSAVTHSIASTSRNRHHGHSHGHGHSHKHAKPQQSIAPVP